MTDGKPNIRPSSEAISSIIKEILIEKINKMLKFSVLIIIFIRSRI